MYSLYVHTNKENGKMYVGITSCTPELRWKKGFGYSDRLPIGRAFRKYGWDGFTHEIIAENLPEDVAKDLEIKLIAVWQTQNPEYGYNICAGGDGVSGWHPSEETKRKIGAAHKGKFGEANPNFGHKWTEEMREKARNRVVSEETRRKQSECAKKKTGEKNSFFGKHHSDETKQIISCIQSKSVSQFSKDMTLINTFSSVRKAAESTGIHKTSISNCCRGKAKTAGGFIWQYN